MGYMLIDIYTIPAGIFLSISLEQLSAWRGV